MAKHNNTLESCLQALVDDGEVRVTRHRLSMRVVNMPVQANYMHYAGPDRLKPRAAAKEKGDGLGDIISVAFTPYAAEEIAAVTAHDTADALHIGTVSASPAGRQYVHGNRFVRIISFDDLAHHVSSADGEKAKQVLAGILANAPELPHKNDFAERHDKNHDDPDTTTRPGNRHR